MEWIDPQNEQKGVIAKTQPITGTDGVTRQMKTTILCNQHADNATMTYSGETREGNVFVYNFKTVSKHGCLY